jgi:uncharacterized protein
VERKRLAGHMPAEGSGSALAGGLYTAEATRLTFARLRSLAGGLLDAGYPVIVDATFLKRDARRPFLELARSKGCLLRILSLQADPDLLRARIRQRRAEGGDASEADLAVLEHQLRTHDPLAADEAHLAVVLAANDGATWPTSREDWHGRLGIQATAEKYISD